MRVWSFALSLSVFLAISAYLIPGYAQRPPLEEKVEKNPVKKNLVPRVGHAVHFDISPPIRHIKPIWPKPGTGEKNKVREIPIYRLPMAENRLVPARDPVVQRGLFINLMPAPLQNFEGISNADNLEVIGLGSLPPDTNGDVGPRHYVQAVNTLIEVFDKQTGLSLFGPFPISLLFAGFGGVCETVDQGDPIVLYDPLADRWLISQFAFLLTPGAIDVPPYHECIAISQTNDPTGAYFRYDFIMPNNKFNDYPKLGVWPDGYYMTVNQFDPFFGPYASIGVFALDRTKMLAGDPDAGFIYFDLSSLDPSLFGMLPADLDGPPPPAGTPNYFVVGVADEAGAPRDALRIFEFHADFLNPAGSTFIERPESPLITAPFDPVFLCTSSANPRDLCIPQPGTNAKLSVISDRLMFRLQYRNFGTHESLVVNHTVDVDKNHAGVRYYEIRRNLPGGSFLIQEQASFAPDANHRWMGSAALDKDGNLAVGYSVSSTTTFPSIRYAGRLATDPPNGLFRGEAVLMAGSGSQKDFSGRWGDYSMLAVDPVDECTFWYTNEYYPTTSKTDWHTRIGTFRFPSCTPPPQGTLQGVVTDAISSGPLAGARIMAGDGTHTFETTTDETGNYSRLLPPGTYTLTASAPGYQTSTPRTVTIPDGSLLTQNFNLNPIPIANPLLIWGVFGDIPVPQDYDGDKKADIAVWRPREGIWYVLGSTGFLTLQPWGILGDRPVPGDYDGDGKADFAVFRPSEAIWYILSSQGTTQIFPFGDVLDIPAPGDYDGNGIIELATFNPTPFSKPSLGKWTIQSPDTKNPISIQWGRSGDTPVPADYDGDGKMDIAVWRPNEGNWYILLSTGGFLITQHGQPGDIPVPADYDGDKKSDMAVWRPAEANWYILFSTGGSQVIPWGQPGDIPVPADYDGNGKADLATWRPRDGGWNILFR